MKYDSCPLYGIKSKKLLKYLLHINDENLFKQKYIISLLNPYIDKTKKPRLIEKPQYELKIVQKRIKTLLGRIEVPNNVFSGIKGRSYADNAKMHIGINTRNVYKIDLTAFFPSISREKVYKFFYNDLKCSKDVAEILTNLTTIDLTRIPFAETTEIYDFLREKKIICFNHLISGAPTSQILSYFVNFEMFNILQEISERNEITMTIYVDDIVFSSERKISSNFRIMVKRIIKKYYYKISVNKEKSYSKKYPKLVTGVVIDCDGKAIVKNSLRLKIITEYERFKANPADEKVRQRLRGLITAVRQIDKSIYPNIYKLVTTKNNKWY